MSNFDWWEYLRKVREEFDDEIDRFYKEPTEDTPCSTCQHPLRSHKKSRPPACRRKACNCTWFENHTPEQQRRVVDYFATLQARAVELAKEV